MALSAQQIAELDRAVERQKSGQATAANAGDVANVKYATEKLGYQYKPKVATPSPIVPAPVTTTTTPPVTMAAATVAQPTPAQSTTPSQAYGDLVSPLSSDEEKARQLQEQIIQEKIGPIDENAIRTSTVNKFQSQIDALNRAYAEQLAAAKKVGLGNLGTNTAIQARRGLVGSDFGTAQTQRVDEENLSREEGIRARQAKEIASIMSEANALADQEISSKKAAREMGAKEYASFVASSAERKKQRIADTATNIVNRGVELTDADFSTLSSQLGTTPDSLKREYTLQKAAREKEQQDIETKKQSADALLQTKKLETFKNVVPAINAALTGDATKDAELIKSMADYYDIDENIVKSQVIQARATQEKESLATEKAKQDLENSKAKSGDDVRKFEQSMASKGYNSATANDAARLRSEGYEVVVSGDKTYYKQPKLEKTTWKGQTVYYNPLTGKIAQQGKGVSAALPAPRVGGAVKKSTSMPSGVKGVAQSAVKGIQSDVASVRGSDNYIDTAKYQQIRENIAVNEPKALSWFDKTYPPKVVLNPNDPTNPYAKK